MSNEERKILTDNVQYKVIDEDCECCTRIDDQWRAFDQEITVCWIATSKKTELAALLMGVTLSELEAAMKLHKEYTGFKQFGLKSIGMTDKPVENAKDPRCTHQLYDLNRSGLYCVDVSCENFYGRHNY